MMVIAVTTLVTTFAATLLTIGALAVEHRQASSLLLMLLSAVVIGVIGAVCSGFYIRHMIAPFWTLVKAARHLGAGDLETPVAIETPIVDLQVLASTLEHTRANLATTLAELEHERDWSQTLLQSILEGIVSYDAECRVTFFSEGAAAITGWTPQETTHRRIDELFVPVDSGSGPFSDHIPSGCGQTRLIVKRRDGQPLVLSITRARQTDDGHTTIVLHDITEESSRRSLQTYFLANISHEFRTPLSGLKVSIELLMENIRSLSPAEAEELLNSMYLSTTSLQHLIDNLLESSKIEANHFSIRRRPTPLNSILAEACRTMQPLLSRRRQPLAITEPLHLPQISADPVRLVQVIVNLLSNASKYSPPATPIDLTVEQQGSLLRLEIADRGSGIPPNQRESIFRRFLRLRSEGRKPGEDYGTGLGLAVVKAIVEAHGGDVGVRERDGGGSVFWFTLPFSEEA
jgi:PAS domain S-box-containing protein